MQINNDALNVTKVTGLDVFAELEKIRGPRFTEYREKWKESENFVVPDFPLMLVLQPDPKCNARCVMCYPVQAPPMEWKVVKDVIEECADEGLYCFTTGMGEFTLYEHFWELLDLLSSKDKVIVDFQLSTNGSLLRQKSQRILNSSITRLEVSIDAVLRSTYKEIRMGLDYDTVVGSLIEFLCLKKLYYKNLPFTRVSFCSNPLNKWQEMAFKAVWNNIVDYVAIQECALYDPAYNPFGNQNKRVLNDPATFRCTMPWQELMVTQDGLVRPCCAFNIGPVVGHIDQGIKKVWHEGRIQRIRDLHYDHRFMDIPECKKCFEGMVKW